MRHEATACRPMARWTALCDRPGTHRPRPPRTSTAGRRSHGHDVPWFTDQTGTITKGRPVEVRHHRRRRGRTHGSRSPGTTGTKRDGHDHGAAAFGGSKVCWIRSCVPASRTAGRAGEHLLLWRYGGSDRPIALDASVTWTVLVRPVIQLETGTATARADELKERRRVACGRATRRLETKRATGLRGCGSPRIRSLCACLRPTRALNMRDLAGPRLPQKGESEVTPVNRLSGDG